MMIELGTKVVSKKTGYPATGTVVGIIEPSFHLERSGAKPEQYKRWNELYPDWLEFPCYIVKFPQCIPTVTKQEFKLGWEHEHQCQLDDYELDVLYKYTVAKQFSAMYPENDLEIED